MTTKPLYLEDSYQKVCTAKVLEVDGKKGNCKIVLDQTVFYPEGGGQPSDQGIIKFESGVFEVKQVLLKGDKIIHEGVLKGELIMGDKVECEINWIRRYHNMQVHSAGHILHEAAKELLPNIVPIEGQHGKKAFIKYQGKIKEEYQLQIKEKTNNLIDKSLAINTEFVTLSELKKRSPWIPERLPTNKPLRIMWVEGYTPIPDGGTQVKSTSEIPYIDTVNFEYEEDCTKVIYYLEIKKKESTIVSSDLSPEVLLNIKNEALVMIMESKDPEELDRLRVHYLGKNGQLTQIAHEIRDAEVGRVFNEAKIAIENALVNTKQPEKISVDETLPGKLPPIGHLHPVTHAIEEISSIFEKIGFVRVRYPEVDWDWYAFEALNMQKTHPARDDIETFFVDVPENKKLGKLVLTPHTSNGQVREMERTKPPIRMINIGKCYRRQSDVSHTVMFHQFEGLVVDEGINITHLKGTIDHFVKQFFGQNRKSRLRPYHFQFTEPSFEVDVTCDICLGRGCKLCKEGWLELGGAGMVHPNVLKAGKVDTTKYTGFAFGWGVERTYMMKSGVKIDDLRLLYSNDIRFLNQF